MGTVLTVKDINVYYGAIHAIKGISFAYHLILYDSTIGFHLQ